MGCHALLQGIFPDQELNSRLLHWQSDSLPLSHLGSPGEVTWRGVTKFILILELSRTHNAYVDDALRRTEEAISSALGEIRDSRVKFRGLTNPQAKASLHF